MAEIKKPYYLDLESIQYLFFLGSRASFILTRKTTPMIGKLYKSERVNFRRLDIYKDSYAIMRLWRDLYLILSLPNRLVIPIS